MKKKIFVGGICVLGVLILALCIFAFNRKDKPVNNMLVVEREISVKELEEGYNNNTIYRKKVLNSIKDYLTTNNIDITAMADNEFKEIKTEDIITDSKYADCSGILKITKYGENYNYQVNSSCNNTTDDLVYQVFEGTLLDTKEVDDNLLIVTEIDKDEIEVDSDVSLDTNNLALYLFDSNGNMLWHNNIIKNTQENKISMIFDDIKKIKDTYYVFVNTTKYGEGEDIYNEYLLKYDLKGNLIEEKEIKIDGVEDISLFYIGESKGNYYYQADSGYSFINNNIAVLDSNGNFKLNTDGKDPLELPDDQMVECDFDIALLNNNIYCFVENEDEGVTLYKADMNGNLISNKTILSKKYGTEGGTYTDGKYIYVKYYDKDLYEKDVYEIKINKYDENLNLVNEIKTKFDIDVEYYFSNMSNNKLLLYYDNLTEEDNNYTVILEDDKVITTYKNDNYQLGVSNGFLDNIGIIKNKLFRVFNITNILYSDEYIDDEDIDDEDIDLNELEEVEEYEEEDIDEEDADEATDDIFVIIFNQKEITN